MDNLKRCPFCGSEPEIYGQDEYQEYVYCDNSKCILNDLQPIQPETWNTRPLEDALQKKIDELDKACHTNFESCLEAVEMLKKTIAQRYALQRKLDIALKQLQIAKDALIDFRTQANCDIGIVENVYAKIDEVEENEE